MNTPRQQPNPEKPQTDGDAVKPGIHNPVDGFQHSPTRHPEAADDQDEDLWPAQTENDGGAK